MSKKTSTAKASRSKPAKPKPDLVCETNTTPNSVVDAKVAKPVTVTYRFFPADATELINLDEGKKPKGDSTKLTGLPIVLGYVEGGTIASCSGENIRRMPPPIKVAMKPKGKAKDAKAKRKDIAVVCHVMPVREVRSGKAFGLLLGVDTKAKYRKHQLFQITPKEHDVVVNVFETYGKHSDGETPTLKETREEDGKKVDYYEAKLTGDIWKKFSHPYTSADVDETLDVKLPAEATQSIKDIYDGKLQGSNGHYSIEANVGGGQKIKFTWAGGTENAQHNISHLDIKTELLNRVQPNTYGALLKAAIEAKVDEVTITSGWRPMLGSMVHRLGLGLDVTYIKHDGKSNHMNRQYGRANENLSQDEKDAYKDVAEKEKALAAAKKAKKSKKEIKDIADDLAAAQNKLKDAIEAAPATTEPKPIKDFRSTLLGLSKVSQVLDPWYMDKNTGDGIAPEVSALGHDPTRSQSDRALEKLHGNHLHITVTDAEFGMTRSKK